MTGVDLVMLRHAATGMRALRKGQPPRRAIPIVSSRSKSVSVRLAEAEAMRGEIPDKQVKEIMRAIWQSARDFGEVTKNAEPPSVAHSRRKIRAIQILVAAHYGVSNDIRSDIRTPRIVRARDAGMYLSRKLTPCSFAIIGRYFRHNHATVLVAVRRVERLIETDKEAAEKIAALKAALS
jgi:chromosomal replication initiation ATPase DnaA